jgi:paraquat-inducible protein A
VTIACPDCGTLQDLPPLPPRSTASCQRCERDLENTSGRSLIATLAASIAIFLVLIPSNILPLIRVDVFGMRAENIIGVGIARLWQQQWVLIAALTALLVIALPFLRFGLLAAVLGALRLGYRPPWLGPVFRWAEWLDPWCMTDVFLLASFVGFYRMLHISQASVSIEFGGACFMMAGFFTMLSRAFLDQRMVWRMIGPEAEPEPGPETLSCTSCELVQPLDCEGSACPRCGARLHARKPDALIRTAALLIAAFILFFPANILPMDVSTRLGEQKNYTIFTGVEELFDSGLWPLGAIIFCTSILIPFGKILAIGWCVASVRLRWTQHLVTKTKIFRLVAELGRWSKTDPFTIVFFVPLMHFGPLGSADAGWGATAFMMMSVLTMVASTTFDPRLMWDAARPRPAP